MIWLLRFGIILELLGAISLSTSLIFTLVKREKITRFWNSLSNNLGRLLNWIFYRKLYLQIRLEKPGSEKSIGIRIRRSYLTLLVSLAIGVVGYFVLMYALSTRNVFSIILALPFAVLSGWVFAKMFSNRIIRSLVFIFFAIASPIIYGFFILSVLLHSILLTGISCIALLHAFLESRTVRKGMIIFGGLGIALGAGLQLAYTFL